MSTTERYEGWGRPRRGRGRPVFDRLEFRLALSGMEADIPFDSASETAPRIQEISAAGADSPIVLADPAPASSVERSPSALRVTFGERIDPFWIGTADFDLVHVGEDGSTTPLSEQEARLTEDVDPSDPSGTRIVLELSRPLANGRYRLVLKADNELRHPGGLPVSTGTGDLEVSTFTVGAVGHGLADAVDLGTAGPEEAIIPGSLDLSDAGGGFALYKLTVPAGHYWRVGLALSAPPSGDALDPVLSLFDAQGRLIATTSLGRPDSPGEPYLFEGVAPGTYFVGVSGEGNVPGQGGGYDPALRTDGSSSIAQGAGGFLLHVVADPADNPTRVLGLRLDFADPASTVPSGLTVQFSGQIRVADLLASGVSPLVVVDDSGRSWPVKPFRYDESQALLSVVFDRALPPGHYMLLDAVDGALVDLAGLSPVAAGLPAGTLASFEVSAGTTPADDLGAILPGAGRGGVGALISLGAGGSIAEHFTVVVPGSYSILGLSASTGLKYSLSAADGSVIAVTPARNGSDKVGGFLLPGTYTLSIGNPGDREYQGMVTVFQESSLSESLLLGGAGQGPALEVRLITPTISLGAGASALNVSPSGLYPQTPASPSTGTGQGAPPGAGAARDPVAITGVSSGSIPLFSPGPVGRPTSAGESIGVVGSAGLAGSVALATSAPGLPGGILGLPARPYRSGTGNDARSSGSRPSEVPTLPAPLEEEVDFDLISRDRVFQADDQTLSTVGWIDRIAAVGFERLESLTGRVAPATRRSDGEDRELAGETGDSRQAERPDAAGTETASIAPSVGLGVLAMIAFKNRARLLGGPARSPSTGPKASPRPLLRGPHRRFRVLR